MKTHLSFVPGLSSEPAARHRTFLTSTVTGSERSFLRAIGMIFGHLIEAVTTVVKWDSFLLMVVVVFDVLI